MTICKTIIDKLTQAKAPGMTAEQAAQAAGITTGAFMNHIKHIRRKHTVLATVNEHDARVKHYRIKKSKVVAVPASKATLSATELEAAITTTLRTHASSRRPMSMDTLRDHVQAPPALVRPAIIALVQREAVARVKGGYHLPEAVLHTPQTVASPRQVDVMRGRYDGAELRPYNGRPGAMDAFSLPSRGMRV